MESGEANRRARRRRRGAGRRRLAAAQAGHGRPAQGRHQLTVAQRNLPPIADERQLERRHMARAVGVGRPGGGRGRQRDPVAGRARRRLGRGCPSPRATRASPPSPSRGGRPSCAPTSRRSTPRAARRAVAQVDADLGHLQAFGLRPIGEPHGPGRSTRRTGPPPGSSTSRCCASGGGSSSGRLAALPARPGRRGPGPRPGHGLRHGPPPHDAPVPRRASSAGPTPASWRARASSTWAAARASWPSPRRASAPLGRWASTRTPSRSRRPARTRDATASRRVARPSRSAACPQRRPLRPGPGQPHRLAARRPRRGPRSLVRAGDGAAGAVAGCWPRASSSTGSRRSGAPSPRPACAWSPSSAEGDWVALDLERPAP